MYHVLNRSVGKMHLFGKDADFEAFQRVMVEAHQRHPIRILSYSVLSNHWHFAVWPDADGQVTAFSRWLAHTHAMRWGLETGTQLVIDSSCVPVSAPCLGSLRLHGELLEFDDLGPHVLGVPSERDRLQDGKI